MADADNPSSRERSLALVCQVAAGDDQIDLAGSPRLLRLQERWPPSQLTTLFKPLCARAARWAEEKPWPEVMRSVVDATLALAPGNEHERLQWASAAISMLVHLTPRTEADGSPPLLNDRRQRTPYGSYPTPPEVASIIADHLATHLDADGATVLDPTIEGAPLLLECARALAGRSARLIGVDRSPAAIAGSTRLFERAQQSVGHYIRPELICADALDTIRALGEIDGLASNPPWGERDRNGRERFSGASDPFIHFVEVALDHLRHGGPFGIVLPGQAAAARTASRLRRRLTETCTIDVVTTLPTRCFPRATVRTILILGRKLRPRGSSVSFVRYRAQPLSEETVPPSIEKRLQSALGKDGTAWLSCLASDPPLRIAVPTIPLGSLAEIAGGIVPYRRGRGRPKQTAKLIADQRYTFPKPRPGSIPLLRSRQVRPFSCWPAAEHVRLGSHLAYQGSHAHNCSQKRIYVRELCGRDGTLVAAVAPAGTAPRYGIITVTLRDDALDPHVLTAIFNSSLIAKYVRSHCDGVLKESFNRIRVDDLRRLPIPETLASGPLSDKLEATSRAIAEGKGSPDDMFEIVNEIVAEAYGALS